jgi:HPt (histidine-containing phosphotransfer) domain-containing protein
VELSHLAAVLAKWIHKSGETGSPPKCQQHQPPAVEPGTLIFNPDAMLRRLMGNRELAATILKGFLQDAPLRLQELCNRLDEADALGVRLEAHSLKGAAATVGAESLQAIAQAMETDAAEARLERCPDHLVRAIDAFESFKKRVEEDGWVSNASDNAAIEVKTNI